MRRFGWPMLLWLVAAVVAGVIVARAHYTADLSAFLPATPNPAQRLLVAQLKEGPASRLVLAAIEGGDSALRARLSKSLAQALAGDARFKAIQNGEGLGNPADQDYVFWHRYLLSDRIVAGSFGAPVLQARIADTVDLLASPLGLMAKDLIGRDPTGETLDTASGACKPNTDQTVPTPNPIEPGATSLQPNSITGSQPGNVGRLPEVNGIPCNGSNTAECIGLSENNTTAVPQPKTSISSSQ